MTAASAAREGARFGEYPIESTLNLPLAASTRVYQGTMLMVALVGAAAGYLTPAAASAAPARVVGVCDCDVDNSSGSAGDKRADVSCGVFGFVNSSSTDAIDATMVGQPCFAVDDQTVARTPGTANTRPYAGRIVGMEGSQVLVAVGGYNPDPLGCVDLFLLAGEDLSTKQYLFVKPSGTTVNTVVANDTAGGDCVGVLQNAPASGAVAVVRTAGKTTAIAGGSVSAWSRIASTNAGKTKAAVSGRTDTSDAGASNDALAGSFCLGIALTAGTADAQHQILLQPMGAIPQTAQ